MPFGTSYDVEATTDGDGRYDVACQGRDPSRTYKLWISSEPEWDSPPNSSINYASTFVGGTNDPHASPAAPCMNPDDPPVITTLHAGGIVTGHVYNPDGSVETLPPDSGHQALDIRLTDLGCVNNSFGDGCPAMAQSTWVDNATGSFAIGGLPPGQYSISLHPDEVVVTVTAGSQQTADIHRRP